jgi:hypothetical protein
MPASYCIALFGALMAPNASADAWDRKSVITFSAPIEIPGVHLAGWGVLPAGTYVFKVVDSLSDRHIIQIFSKDELTLYATILAIPNYRLQATDKTVMTFRERAAGEPEALRAWFYPGRNWGEEFVYPKVKAVAIAKAANSPVLFTPVELPVEVSESAHLMAAPVMAQLKEAPIKAIQPTGEEVHIAQVVTPPPAAEMSSASSPEAASQPSQVEKTLPSTASEIPLFFLLGLIAIGAGFVLRTAGQRA